MAYRSVLDSDCELSKFFLKLQCCLISSCHQLMGKEEAGKQAAAAIIRSACSAESVVDKLSWRTVLVGIGCMTCSDCEDL